MSDEHIERTSPGGLRGWLSDVMFPTLIEGPFAPLVARLGPRAAIESPLFGRAAGQPAYEALLKQAAEWLTAHNARYTRTALLVGIDRDVTEGTLALTLESDKILLPVAVVAERRKSREVELRIYHATRMLRPDPPLMREPVAAGTRDLILPRVVLGHLDALRKGDVDALLACFEPAGFVRDARGVEHRNSTGGLRSFYEQRVGGGHEGAHVAPLPGGYADDGRSCAVELTTTLAGQTLARPSGLAVYERGEDGLLEALRLYEELDA